MKFDVKKAMLLYAITDRHWLNGRTLAHDAEECLRGGATMLQLREKDLSHGELVAEGREIKELCRKYSVPFCIDDDVEAAIELGADCIHVGQSDMEAGDVRGLVGDDMVLGVSAVSQARLAEERGADYLGVGACFATSTKKDADTIPLELLREICGSVNIPVVAIGGISESNILELKGYGIDGVSVISAIFGSSDIRGTTERLLKLSKEVVEG